MIKSMIGLNEIDGLPVREIEDFNELSSDKTTKVFVNHEYDILAFKVQTRVPSNGGYGCQIEDLIRVVYNQLNIFNNIFQCEHNYKTLEYLKQAIKCQQERTQDRIARGVEGENKQ
jgi:hypothetical protein